jgi:hypothetical protein
MKRLKLFGTYHVTISPIKHTNEGFIQMAKVYEGPFLMGYHIFTAPVTNIEVREYFLNLLINTKNK